jgi:UDP-2,3-diacylglucosamine hydrolase
MTKPVFVVSDVHVGAVPASTERAFRDFLDYAVDSASSLVINGDLFDVWVPSSRFVHRAYVRVISKLADMTESGFPVSFVGGNHDAEEYIGDVLAEDAGVQVLSDPARVQLGRFRALLAHGDGARESGGQYAKENAALRRLLRVPVLRVLAEHLLPLEWVHERASRWSRVPGIVARQQRGQGTGPKYDAPRLEAWARAILQRSADVDVVLAGHSHLPACIEVFPDRFYVNTGDWIEHMSYSVLPSASGPPELRTWPSREALVSLRAQEGATVA